MAKKLINERRMECNQSKPMKNLMKYKFCIRCSSCGMLCSRGKLIVLSFIVGWQPMSGHWWDRSWPVGRLNNLWYCAHSAIYTGLLFGHNTWPLDVQYNPNCYLSTSNSHEHKIARRWWKYRVSWRKGFPLVTSHDRAWNGISVFEICVSLVKVVAYPIQLIKYISKNDYRDCWPVKAFWFWFACPSCEFGGFFRSSVVVSLDACCSNPCQWRRYMNSLRNRLSNNLFLKWSKAVMAHGGVWHCWGFALEILKLLHVFHSLLAF